MVSKRNMLMADENPMDLLHLITRIRNQRERSRLGFARVVMSSRMEPNELPTYFHYYKNFIFTKRNNYSWLYIHKEGTGNDYFSILKAPLWGNVSKA